MKKYELLAVFKPNLDTDDVEKAIKKVSTDVEGFGGKIESTEKIGRKKLANEVKDFRDGFFTTSIVTMPADKIKEFNRQLKLNDTIIRTMFVEVSQKASV